MKTVNEMVFGKVKKKNGLFFEKESFLELRRVFIR